MAPQSAFVNGDDAEKKELTDGKWIMVRKSLSYLKWTELYKVLGETDKFTTAFLLATVKGWNFEDTEGHIADITAENIRNLNVIVVAEMMKAITEQIKLPLAEMRSIGSSILPSKPGAGESPKPTSNSSS